jgi:hypothetical protein
VVRLGDGTDILGRIAGLTRGGGMWPKLAGWFEQGSAQALQEPEPGWGHGQAAPAAGGPVQDGPHEADAAGLAGEAADDLFSTWPEAASCLAACRCRKLGHPMRPGSIHGVDHRDDLAERPLRLGLLIEVLERGGDPASVAN